MIANSRAQSLAIRGETIHTTRQPHELRRVWADGLTALGSHLLAIGSHAEAADAYRRLLRADEWDEAAHRQLMAALALSGQRGEALRHYDRLVTLLHRELEAAPARETTALHDRLRRGDFGD